jgi:hypothetical protein
MTHRIPGRLAAATLFGLFAVVAPRVNAQVPTPPASQQKPKVTIDSAAGSVQTPATAPAAAAGAAAAKNACTIKFDATPVQVAPSPVTLQASVMGALGDSVSATVAPESKISVVGVKAAGAPNALELTLNTSQAVPGEYTISFKGTSGQCATKLKVGAAEK